MSTVEHNVHGNATVSRRGLLRGAAALAGVATTGITGTASAATSVDVVMINNALSGPLRASIEGPADVKINDAPFISTTDAVSRLMAPGGTSRSDLMLAGVEFAAAPVMGARSGDERVLPLDLSLIPNFQHLDDFFTNDVVRRDGKVFIIPIYWGFDSPLFNKDRIPEADPYTQAWGVLFEDKYAGRIAWADAGHQMFMAAGLHLGMTDPAKMSPREVNEVAQFLISKKKNIRTIYSGGAEGANLLASGEVYCLYGALPMRTELQNKGFNITNAWPKEGVLSLIYAAFIPKDSSKARASHAMINALLGQPYVGQLTKQCGYLSASKLATQGVSPEELQRSGYGILNQTTKAYRLLLPTNVAAIIQAWARVKSA